MPLALAIHPEHGYATGMVGANEHPEDPQTLRLARGIRVHEAAISFRFVRASGPGGQNVNKRATCAQMRVSISEIRMTERARDRLRVLAGSLVNDDDELVIVRDSTRSQRRNKDACIEALKDLAQRASVVPKQRRATKPSRASVQRRIDEKKHRGRIKRGRKDTGDEG